MLVFRCFQGVYLTRSNTVDGSEILREHQLRVLVFLIICKVLYIFQVVVWDFWTMNSSDKWRLSSGSPTKNVKALVLLRRGTTQFSSLPKFWKRRTSKTEDVEWLRRWTFFYDAVRRFWTTSMQMFDAQGNSALLRRMFFLQKNENEKSNGGNKL